MPNRYDVIPEWQWPDIGPAFQALAVDLTAVESKVANASGLKERAALTVSSPPGDIMPYLPIPTPAPGGVHRAVNRIAFGSSTSYPTAAVWPDPYLLAVRIINPATSTVNLNIGYGTYGSTNHATEPDVVAPGKEWVGGASAVPVFARADSGTIEAVVIAYRSAV